MNVLLCHNYYQQPGGEDRVFADETWLLRSHGHRVVQFTEHNDRIKQMGRWEVARRTIWSSTSVTALRALIRQERPDVVHCANTFPLLSPAVAHAARAEGVAIVQSLHNYRLVCPNAFLLRQGRVCEACLGKRVAWPGVLNKCYRNDRAASAVVATMLAVHRAARTWSHVVSQYVAQTEFARRKFIEGGLPASRIAVKPNFVHPDPGPGSGEGGYVVCVGRLSDEKGLGTLLDAWQQVSPGRQLVVVGEGPLGPQVQAAARHNDAIRWLGGRAPEEVAAIIGDAACLVQPSIWYESCPKTVLEAFLRGTPVIASRLGSLAELVEDGRTGLHFEPGNAEDLAATVERALDDAGSLASMRRAAREEYERKYAADGNYERLMQIYEIAQRN